MAEGYLARSDSSFPDVSSEVCGPNIRWKISYWREEGLLFLVFQISSRQTLDTAHLGAGAFYLDELISTLRKAPWSGDFERIL